MRSLLRWYTGLTSTACFRSRFTLSSVTLYPGNTKDSTTLLGQVENLKQRFGLNEFTLVGDRGMITGNNIAELKNTPGVSWVTALPSVSIQPLIAGGVIQPSLFEETNMLELFIDDNTFDYRVNADSVATEALLDGIYIIRSNVPAEAMSAQETVLAYKGLKVEQAFRTSKSFNLLVRPVHHHLDDRVKAHFLITTLAYYVTWHMQRAWASLTFTDEEAAPADRDPVTPAARSQAAETKASRKQLPNGDRPPSFKTLLASLASIARCTYHYPSAPAATFHITTQATPQQAEALNLLKSITVWSRPRHHTIQNHTSGTETLHSAIKELQVSLAAF